MSDELQSAIHKAQSQPAIGEALRRIYAHLQAETNRQKPRCDASGACCHFEAYGHRLYISTIELAHFAGQLAATDRSHTALQRPTAGGPAENENTGNGALSQRLAVVSGNSGQCQFQVDGLCSVHVIRPFGCRIFFCDPSAETWQQAQYESAHAEIKALHEQFDIPYFYMEWRAALSAIGVLREAS